MVKVDCAINKYVAQQLKENYEWIINATADCTENFGIDDIMFSAGTEENYIGVPCEVKSIKGGWQLKYDDDWNNYFTCGIYNKLTFHKEPPTVGTPIYFINATDYRGDYSKGKYQKLLENHACLVYIAPDGMIIFSPKELKNAFVGYADYFVRHTTEYGKNNKRLWETKAVLDLSQGTYVPCNPPIELFEK
jgi:hypothetical protein